MKGPTVRTAKRSMRGSVPRTGRQEGSANAAEMSDRNKLRLASKPKRQDKKLP